MPGRTNKDCRKRFHYKVSSNANRGAWTRTEDERLRGAVQKYGFKWCRVAIDVGTRNGDQCSKRWQNTIDPRIDHSAWSSQDVSLNYISLSLAYSLLPEADNTQFLIHRSNFLLRQSERRAMTGRPLSPIISPGELLYRQGISTIISAVKREEVRSRQCQVQYRVHRLHCLRIGPFHIFQVHILNPSEQIPRVRA